jgi:hypothetical protein
MSLERLKKLGGSFLASFLIFSTLFFSFSPALQAQTLNPASSEATLDQLASILASLRDLISSLITKSEAQTADITTGLIGHWKFDEGAGTTASDSSGNNNTGTLTNGPTWTSGKVGSGALQFDGVNDEIPFDDVSAFDFSGSNQFTYSAWVYPRSSNAGKVVLSRGSAYSSPGYTVYYLGTNFDGSRWRTDVSDGVNLKVAQSNIGAVSLNQWQHLTVVWNGTTLSLYKDGTLLASNNTGTFNGVWNGSTATVRRTSIAATGMDNSGYFNGDLDDVRIYNRALSSTDITALYNYTGSSYPTPYTTPPPADTTPPTVSNVSVTNVTSTGATISFTTSEASTAVVSYGSNATYSSSVNLSSGTNHTTTLTNLTPSAAYDYRIQATDASSNTSNYSLGSFTTLASYPTPAYPTPAPSPSTNIHYIRVGATGNNSGSDWNNAWNSFSSVVWTRGHTYYVADGVYPQNVVISKQESENQWIYVYKATNNDHGTDTGWSNTYGDGAAEIQGRLDVGNSYIEIDGRVGSDNSGYGFRIDPPGVGTVLGILSLTFDKTYFHLYHTEIAGSGSPGSNPYSNDVENGLYLNGTSARQGIHIANNWIHHVNRDGIVLGSSNGLIFEHNRIERTGGHADPAVHGQGMDFSVNTINTGLIIRHNKFVDIVGSANISFLGGSNNTDIHIYGNIFWSSDQNKYWSSPGVIWTRSTTPAVTVNGFYVYNNTFHNIKLAQIANDAVNKSNGFVRNNIWEGSTFTGLSPVHRGVTAEYNYYYNNSGTPPIGTTDVLGSASPFLNAANRDYRLLAGSSAIDRGVNLGSNYEVDRNGVLRPQGTAWDMGAYEFETDNPYATPAYPTPAYPTPVYATPAATTTATTTPTSTKFSVGQRVQANTNVNVRASASTGGTLLGTQTNGSLGTVLGGPIYADSLNWWNINYDSGADGYSAEDFLTLYTESYVTPLYTTPTSYITPYTTPTSTGTGYSSTPMATSNSGGGATSNVSISSNSNLNLTRNLSFGSTGSDVVVLQDQLIKTGYLAPGYNTGYYGAITRAAVQKYQCAQGIICTGDESTTGYGAVDLKTRTRLGGSSGTTTPTSLTEVERQALITQIKAQLAILIQQLILMLAEEAGN